MHGIFMKNTASSLDPGEIPAWLAAAREKSARELAGWSWPSGRDEEWKYTDPSALGRQSFGPFTGHLDEPIPAALKPLPGDSVVFVNGRYRADLSALPVDVEHFSAYEGLLNLPPELRASFARPFSNDSPLFCALNLIHFQDPVLLRVRKAVGKCHLFYYYSEAASGCAFFPRICVQVQRGAGLILSETHYVEGKGCFIGNVSDIFLEEGASVEFMRFVVHKTVASQVSAARIHQRRNSHSRSFFYTNGGGLVRDNLSVLLNDHGADAVLNGLHVLNGVAQADSHTYVEHAAPNAASSQLYKSILNGESHSVFNGKIVVRQEAQLTSSYQLNKNLILSPEARVDTKPQLEIMADNVKCTHGATIGQLDEDQLFYLQARGIVRAEALRMLTEGFVDDVISKITDPGARSRLRAVMDGHSFPESGSNEA